MCWPIKMTEEDDRNTLIVGSQQEYNSAVQLMKDAGLHERVLGRVAVTDNDTSGIGYWKKINLLAGVVPFREVVFCEGTLSFANIIAAAQQLPVGTALKFRALGANSIVGSNSKDSSGEFVAKENGFKLKYPHNRRIKRLIDVGVAFTGIILFPLTVFIVRKPFSFFANCFNVLLAEKTWIGYCMNEQGLPRFAAAGDRL